MSEEQSQPPTVTVRVATELLEMARIICAHTKGRQGKQLKIVDYLDSILRPVITEAHSQVMERIAAEQAKPEASGPSPRRKRKED